MDKVIDLHANFHTKLLEDDVSKELLNQEKVTILGGFNENIALVRRYYQTVYANEGKRIVLCGINPGRNGAGKTGIPFIDYHSASQLLPDVNHIDQERSSQFIYSVIEEIGINLFYENVYMTNLSWFGFIKEGKNLNYYDLPQPLPTVFTDSFVEEMELIQPKAIVPLSKEVEYTLRQMKKSGKLHFPLAERMPHPYYCSMENRKNKYREVYVDRISTLMEKD